VHGEVPYKGLILDGYRLIRPIGGGGFGEVWLCRSETVGGYHALKFTAGERPELLEKEFHALVPYRKELARIRAPSLIPIEHVNRTASRLYYAVPLGDGLSNTEPSDSSWRPLTLGETINQRAEAPPWFGSTERMRAL